MFTNHVEADFVVGASTVEDGNAVPAADLLGHRHLSVCNSQSSTVYWHRLQVTAQIISSKAYGQHATWRVSLSSRCLLPLCLNRNNKTLFTAIYQSAGPIVALAWFALLNLIVIQASPLGSERRKKNVDVKMLNTNTLKHKVMMGLYVYFRWTPITIRQKQLIENH